MDVPQDPLRDDWLDRPHASRLGDNDPHATEIRRRHRSSVEANLPSYFDPLSGFSVFTAAFLAKRGSCCESGCRHCPFVV